MVSGKNSALSNVSQRSLMVICTATVDNEDDFTQSMALSKRLSAASAAGNTYTSSKYERMTACASAAANLRPDSGAFLQRKTCRCNSRSIDSSLR